MLKSGQNLTTIFTVSDPTDGSSSDADSLPTGLLYINGTVNAASVTVTNITTGVYKAAVTLPSLNAGDVVDIRISATVGGTSGEGKVFCSVIETKRVSDLQDITTAQVNAECDTALSDYDAATGTELAALQTHGDSDWITATGFSTHSAADVRTEMDANSTQLADIVAFLEDLEELKDEYDFVRDDPNLKFYIYHKGTTTVYEEYDTTLDIDGKLLTMKKV